MKRNKFQEWVHQNRKGVIIGFVFGAIIAPLLATLGLVSTFIEALRFVLVGPMLLIGAIIPNVQIGPDTFYVPMYKWVLTLFTNGVFYAFIGGVVQYALKKF